MIPVVATVLAGKVRCFMAGKNWILDFGGESTCKECGMAALQWVGTKTVRVILCVSTGTVLVHCNVLIDWDKFTCTFADKSYNKIKIVLAMNFHILTS